MFKNLPGFREFYPEDLAGRSHIFKCWRKTAGLFGFREFEPPVLEQLELFTEKSGEEIKSQLFEFVDKGGRAVALRPEMTPSLARMVGAKAGGIRKPVKWFAIGENYRYERQQKGRLRAFYQFNADILGEESVNADAEIIALLVECLKSLGLSADQFKVRLGDRDLWILFLGKCGVPEDMVIPALSVVDKIERVSEEAFEEMLASALGGLDLKNLSSKLREFSRIRTMEELKKAFESNGSAESESSEKISTRLGEWEKLFEALDSLNVAEFVSVDMGIVRGLAYYTGFVFEAFQTVGAGRALAGGGRYDSLTKKLGYQEMPAVGFGMGDVTVSDLLALVGLAKTEDCPPDVFLVIGSPAVRSRAVRFVSELRALGFVAEYSYKDSNFGKQFKQADSLGAKYALILGDDEIAKNVVKVKNLKSGEESILPANAASIADLIK